MSRIPLAILLAATAAATVTLEAPRADAQSLIDPSAPLGVPAGRFQMQPVEGGIARLDTRTGTIDLCRVDGDGIVCDERRTEGSGERARIAAPPTNDADAGSGDGTAGEGEAGEGETGKETLQSLHARIGALEDRVSALEDRLDQPLLDPKASDLAIDRMRQFFRGFADIARELDDELSNRDRDEEAPPSDETIPDPTMPGRT